MNNITEEHKQKIISIISSLLPDCKVYLFGSRATGDYSHGSDVDIAIITKEKCEPSVVGEVREVLNATNIPHKIDVVDFHRTSKEMKEIILKEGILWKN